MFSQGLILVMKNDVTQMSTIFIFTLLCSLQGIVQHVLNVSGLMALISSSILFLKAFIVAGLFAYTRSLR